MVAWQQVQRIILVHVLNVDVKGVYYLICYRMNQQTTLTLNLLMPCLMPSMISLEVSLRPLQPIWGEIYRISTVILWLCFVCKSGVYKPTYPHSSTSNYDNVCLCSGDIFYLAMGTILSQS